MRRLAALVAVTLMAACSGALSGSDQDAKGGTGGAAGAMGSPPVLPSDVAALCDAPGGNELTFQDRADAQVHLIGRWILCCPPGLTWATEQADQGGIELGADMSWHILRWVGRADERGRLPGNRHVPLQRTARSRLRAGDERQAVLRDSTPAS